MSQVKLIWDFRSGDAEGMAAHHAEHLKEFAVKAGLSEIDTGFESAGDSHWIAWLVVPEERMIEFRDALRPHRGQRVK